MDYGTGGFSGAATNGFGFPINAAYMGAGYGGPPQRVVLMNSQGGHPGQQQGGAPDDKPTNFREGDWMCSSCGSHNYQSRHSCRQCRGQKDANGGGGGHDNRGRGNGRAYSRSRSRSPGGDRKNGDRGGHRDGGRDNSCYAFQRGECTRGDSCRFDHVRSGGHRSGGRGDHGGHHGNGAGGRDNSCFAFTRGECTRGDSCRFDHNPNHVRSGGRGYGGGSGYNGARNTHDNSCYAFQRGQCDRGDTCRYDHVLSTHPEKNAMRTGDWWCGTCQVLKYAFRDVCSTCNSTKDATSEGKITAFLELKRAKGLPGKFLPGDWVCTTCQDHVFARKEKCGKCENLRPEGADPEVSAIFGEAYLLSRRKDASAAANMAE